MEFSFTESEKAFRREIRDFLASELPEGWDPELEDETDETWAFARQFCKKLSAKSWVGLSWPTEYGGQARKPIEQAIFTEEMSYARAPIKPIGMGVDRAGPSIILHGTDEQKRRLLPRIISADLTFCQGFTEPSSGSDLASLQTRAVEDGDYFVVNGQKVFTTNAHRADYCMLATRTDLDAPKHRGITYLLMDMRLPGVTVRPMREIVGVHTINEVFLDNVRIPRNEMLGEKNRGWYVITSTLDYERSGLNRLTDSKRNFDNLVKMLAETGLGQSPRASALRNRLADAAICYEVGRLLGYRVAWMQQRGLVPNYEASMSKLFGDEVTQRVANLGMEALGMYGPLAKGSKWVKLAGRLNDMYLRAMQYTIAAGTSEIQRNIIATRGLGLPR